MKILISIGIILAGLNLLAQTTVSYTPSTDDFANPERGFYRYSATHSNNYTFLDQATLEGYRLAHTPFGADYEIYSTLVFRYFYLDDFKQSDISQVYLDNIQTDFNTARAAGVKLIPRFAYTNDVDGTGCPSWICPPYGDASKTWVLNHIAQITPVLQANKDVTALVQMGFIGVWGENYYTDFFGDASQPPNYKLEDQNWLDRIEVLDALLDAVPQERMVQVRYPQMKQRTIYGVNALTNSNPLTALEAFDQSDKARIGFHNDCLLASDNDYGTYNDYGNSATWSMSDTANLKPYFTEDSRYVVVGGETCDDIYSPQNDCFGTHPDARADSELERLHYSYLNAQYNNDVNNDWQSGGCMDQIKRRLGYRFELLDGTYSDAAQTGQSISVNINLRNVGYASPFNQRDLILILRDTSNNQFWFAELPDDPRFWFAEDASLTISHTICIPDFMPVGSYELLLHLPDPEEDLYDRPEYAIRLANKLADNSDVWEATTGYNRLGHYVDINSTANAEVCNGGIPLSSTDSTASIPQNSLNSIKVFPNPATETLHIAGLESHDLVGLKIISTLGKIEIDGQISENGVDISALSSGLYLVKIELSNGSTRTFKVYKK